MSFLDLPYDVRHAIYLHLFPRPRHLYLHATENGPIYLATPDSAVPTALLQTCKALHQEAREYLYNSYVFDVYGQKSDIVKAYGQVRRTVEKYARDEVHVRAFSNGLNSSTGCISIAAGDAKLASVERRGRGQATTVEKMRGEEEMKRNVATRFRDWAARIQPDVHRGQVCLWAAGAVGLVVCLLLVVAIEMFRSRYQS